MGFRSSAMALTIVAALTGPVASAQTPAEAALAAALSHGGYVIVMRHAHAPKKPPTAAEADRSNDGLERQLDAVGRASAKAMGDAMRTLHLPVGAVWSSPTYRARETVRLARLRAPRIAAELGDNGRSMQGTSGGQAAWLRSRANEAPRRGTDTIIVTQFPNISGAFGDAAAGMQDGEALVFRPTVGTGPRLMGRLAIEQWPALAKRSKHKERNHGA